MSHTFPSLPVFPWLGFDQMVFFNLPCKTDTFLRFLVTVPRPSLCLPPREGLFSGWPVPRQPPAHPHPGTRMCPLVLHSGGGGVFPVLASPLSGSVTQLCPLGSLKHFLNLDNQNVVTF